MCRSVKNQDLTRWDRLNRSDGDGCLYCFLFMLFLKNRMWTCEIWVLGARHITQSYQLFVNSESDCWRAFITTQWFTMTKDTDYDFEYNFPNHLHLNINTLIHSHLMLSKSSLSQRNKDKDQCWKQSIEAHLHFNSFQSITLQSHYTHVYEVIRSL